MVSYQKVILLVAAALLISMVLESRASPLRRYQLEDSIRQEVVNLASQIIKLVTYRSEWEVRKRNGGTLDSLYILPDLTDKGRR
ncbi:cerebrin prohormone-like [Gigantopelta aegis]|uniref:cerebrin prohormone-like n=1 Tax=Gigantopelta aegis TaxID=1735272 RepID=UPI001B88E730|nr:cerebrin prohormone-like [Gigantopelta aegis]